MKTSKEEGEDWGTLAMGIKRDIDMIDNIVHENWDWYMLNLYSLKRTVMRTYEMDRDLTSVILNFTSEEKPISGGYYAYTVYLPEGFDLPEGAQMGNITLIRD